MHLIDLPSILGALGLVSSIAKPLPIVGPIASGLVRHSWRCARLTLGTATGALDGLLGGDGLGILATTGDGGSGEGGDGDEENSRVTMSTLSGQNTTGPVSSENSTTTTHPRHPTFQQPRLMMDAL